MDCSYLLLFSILYDLAIHTILFIIIFGHPRPQPQPPEEEEEEEKNTRGKKKGQTTQSPKHSQSPQQPALPEIIRVHNASISKLHSLTGVIHPGEIHVECSLYHAEEVWDWIPMLLRTEASDQPVQDVECSVGPQRY